MSDNNQDKSYSLSTEKMVFKSTLNDKFASWILFIVILVLLGGLFVVVYRTYSYMPDVRRVEICYVPADSALVAQADKNARLIMPKESLDSVISSIQIHEYQLEQKYQYIVEKRDEEDNYRNLFMLVFGIVISVVGFFGYRKFSDIEEKALKVAADKADEVANSVAKSVAKTKANKVAVNYCNNNVGKKVDDYLKINLQRSVDSKIDDLYEGSGKESIVKELEDTLDLKIWSFLKSDEGKELIINQVEKLLQDKMQTELSQTSRDGSDQIDQQISEDDVSARLEENQTKDQSNDSIPLKSDDDIPDVQF